MSRKLLVLAAVGGVFGLVLAADKPKPQTFTLTVIHTNDNHSHHEPQPTGDGGDARQAAVIRQLRAGAKASILLDAGDRFTGTLFHTEYKGLDNLPEMNAVGFEAMAVGNHEFDEGDPGLAKFIDGLKCPVLAANIDASKSKTLAGKIKPFTVLRVGGHEVGIIGLCTVDTKTGSRPSRNVTFDANYAACVQRHVDALTEKGVNKVIVLSHIGLSEDIKLAGAVTGVDAIVGGHSHTLLSNTYKEAKFPYPAVVKGKDGSPVYVVQAGGGDNRFVGKLELEFDGAGRVTKASGDTILLSKFITPNPEIQAEIDRLARPIRDLKKKVILDRKGEPARAAADMPNAQVREGETLLGNLVTDAFRAKTGARVAVVGGGGLRSGMEQGPLTVGDVFKVLPFSNQLTSFRLRGADLKAALEHGVSRYGVSGSGRFLQVSGLRYGFDPNRPIGQRVRWVEVRQADGAFAPLDPNEEYSVACDSYLKDGGDDYAIFRDRAKDAYRDWPSVQDVVMEHIAANSPVAPKLEGRIRVLEK